MDAQDFRFVAFTASSNDPNQGFRPKSVLLDIREQDEAADAWLKDIWDKMRQSVSNYHKANGDAPGWANWKPHEWAKAKVPNRQKYIAWTGDVIAGFLFLRTEVKSNFDHEKSIIYMENIATAPGNQKTPLWSRRLTFVGRALFAFAVLQSLQQGMEGILGLHAADDGACSWYKDLNERQGGRLFHPETTGVAAPPPHSGEDRTYFETTKDGSIEFLEGYRHG